MDTRTMRPAKSSEHRLIEWIEARSIPLREEILRGIGDDAAILRLPGRSVATADAIIEGIHFQSPPASWREVGFKAMAVNLSDVAAMGCRPVAAIDCLAIGPALSDEDAQEIVAGLQEAAEPHEVPLIGGDLTASPGPTMIAVTLLGRDVCGRVLTRDGALAGDEIWITGSLGGSIEGRHLRPVSRIDFALAINSLLPVTSAIDVSDGLALDLHRLASASRVSALLESDRIPIHSSANGVVERALGDGEDFELLFTIRPGFESGITRASEKTNTPVTRIGRIESGDSLSLLTPDGTVQPLAPTGYLHEWRE